MILAIITVTHYFQHYVTMVVTGHVIFIIISEYLILCLEEIIYSTDYKFK